MQLKFDLSEKPRAQQTTVKEKSLQLIPTERDGVRETFAEINKLIGLSEIKTFLYEVHAYTEIQQRRRKQQLKAEPTVLHTIFSGNPGSGKTTVARLMAKLYHEMGVLSKGHLVEVERADLVGEFIGHTAQRTREQIKKSLGGVMFIDEAYSLVRGGEKDFGREAIDALVKGMEDHRDDFVLILAGYSREMQCFLQSNPGLSSRFPLQMNFPDYSVEELARIASVMYGNHQYRPTEAALSELERILLRERARSQAVSFGNARTVRNLVEGSLRTQAVRLMNEIKPLQQPDVDALCRIEKSDIIQAAARLEKIRQEKRAAGEIIYMNN